MSELNSYDVALIGAGIVGLATAYQLSRISPMLKIAILEKEEGPARHQTGHNSGVIHSGIYYKPGGSKALNCAKGYRYLLGFARQHDIPHDICGKVIVATRAEEQPRLRGILERGRANGMQGVKMISAGECREIEPHVNALEAIWVPQAGIIDYKAVAERYLHLVLEKGGKAYFSEPVLKIGRQPNGKMLVQTEKQALQARLVISCAGLYADKMAKQTTPGLGLQILPFRGEYYELKPERQHLVNNLVYPVPNPNFPFLGVHYTRMIHGGIEAGPNAVLAFAREGYSRWDVNYKELLETLSFPGFQQIARKYWRDGLGELYRSYSKAAFVRALQHLIPEVGEADLQRGGAGVRAMACAPDGTLIDDFRILEQKGAIHVCNAPSPAATASLAIGETVAQKALKQL